MLFIWNDERCKWIGESECFDSDYVIVRKLFVKYEGKEPFNENFVRTVFGEYGAIDSVEIITPKKTSWDLPSANLLQAYVTYIHNSSASLAYENFVTHRRSFIVEPANTWHQPIVHSGSRPILSSEYQSIDTSVNKSHFEHLIEDCLLKVFEYCEFRDLVHLAETCTTFNDVLSREIFFKIKKLVVEKTENGYRVTFDSPQTTMYYGSLAVARKVLRCIGGHIEELSVNLGSVTTENQLKRFLQIVNKYVSSTMRKLDLIGAVTASLLHEMRPVLVGLDTLNIERLRFVYVDLQTLCPNLRKLVICSCCSVQLSNIRRLWQSLQRLSIVKCIKHIYHVLPDTLNNLNLFFRMNPQIKTLKYDFHNVEMKYVCGSELNIERLTIGGIGVSPFDTWSFQWKRSYQFKQLKQLHLKEISQNNIIYVLNYFEDFTNLVQLKLTFLRTDTTHVTIDVDAFSGIAQKLHRLEIFGLNDCSINEDAVANFIRFSKHLKELHLRKIIVFPGGLLSNSFTEKIVEARKVHQQSALPLKLFVDETNLTLVGTILHTSEIRRHLTIQVHSKY